MYGSAQLVARSFVVNADLVYRHLVHVSQGGGSIDVNHFNSAEGPLIPVRAAAQRVDLQALCSNGPISVQEAPYRFTYKGLLVRAEKRLSQGVQILASYAYSSNTGTNVGNGFNLDNWLENRGPTANDFTHILNIAATTRLPWRLELGLNFSQLEHAAVQRVHRRNRFSGDGTAGDLLPGTTVNAFNRGLGPADLERLVSQFNQTYAGTMDKQGAVIPRVTLPAHYSFGEDFHSLDMRLSRLFVIQNRWRLSIVSEAFDLYNQANLSGYSGDLTSSAFGQPTSRATQIFGSGGPRAFQVAARLSF